MPTETPSIAGLPGPLRWAAEPTSWSEAEGVLAIAAGPRTDLFIDPQGAPPALNAPRLLCDAPEGDWLLSAVVEVDFQATFDAGVLLVWADERTWGKLCFEYSPQGDPMVVSVVTRGVSDDANAFTVAGRSVALRIARIGAAYAFHARVGAGPWQLIRHFSLGETGPVAIGLVAQSPTGEACTAHFSAVSFTAARLADLRSGV
jgi:regulation of enolase protein 1 (concanavalin A-like superfamily)